MNMEKHPGISWKNCRKMRKQTQTGRGAGAAERSAAPENRNYQAGIHRGADLRDDAQKALSPV